MARRLVRTACAGACAGTLATLIAWAETPARLQQQQQQQQQTGQRTPVFREGAVLVTVDAYPQRDGRIVEGLTAADFEIFEDGVRQRVENFEFVRIEPSLSESERHDPNSLPEAYALAADPHNRVFIVFLDALHVTVEGSHDIRRPLVDTLNRIIAPNDLFGVVTQDTLPRHLVLGRRLLTVEEQLSRHWPWGERYRLGTDRNDPMEDTLEACFSIKPNAPEKWWISDNGQERVLYELLIDRRREDRTLTSLEGFVDRLAGMREARTAMFVVSEGWRLFQRDQSLADEAQAYGPQTPRVGVTGGGQLSVTDPTGRQVSPSTCTTELARLAMLDSAQRLRDLIERANRANVSFYPVAPNGLAVFDTPISERSRPSLQEDGNRLRLRANGLRTLAENTDGIAIVNRNDLSAGMRRIVDDVSAFYLLGYYSTNTKHDGKYRRIEVKVTEPGLQLRARRGYVAPTETRAAPPGTGAAAGNSTVTDALEPLARLRPDAAVFTRAALEGDILRVAVELPLARVAAGGDVRITAGGLDGRALPAVSGRIEPGARGALISVPLQALKPPLRVTAHVVVAGETFDDSVDVAVPAHILLGDAVVYRGRAAPTAPLQPAADPRFSRRERLHAEWTLPAALDARTARLLGRNGQPLAVPVDLTERQRDGRTVLAASVILTPLAAGDYVLELSVSRGTATEQKLTAFRVSQ